MISHPNELDPTQHPRRWQVADVAMAYTQLKTFLAANPPSATFLRACIQDAIDAARDAAMAENCCTPQSLAAYHRSLGAADGLERFVAPGLGISEADLAAFVKDRIERQA